MPTTDIDKIIAKAEQITENIAADANDILTIKGFGRSDYYQPNYREENLLDY